MTVTSKNFLRVILICAVFMFTGARASDNVDLHDAEIMVNNMLADIIATEAKQHNEIPRNLMYKYIDIQWIARFLLGKNWQSMTEEERKNFTNIYTRFAIQTYLNEIGKLNNQSIVLNGINVVGKKHKRYVANLLITNDNQESLYIELMIHKDKQNNMKIYDIKPNGISVIITQRSEFTEIINNNGLNELIALMRQKAMNK